MTSTIFPPALQNEVDRHWRGRLQVFLSRRHVAAEAERSSTAPVLLYLCLPLPLWPPKPICSHHSPLMGWSMLTNRQLMLSCPGTHSFVSVCFCTKRGHLSFSSSLPPFLSLYFHSLYSFFMHPPSNHHHHPTPLCSTSSMSIHSLFFPLFHLHRQIYIFSFGYDD